jgi:hypothetical protein
MQKFIAKFGHLIQGVVSGADRWFFGEAYGRSSIPSE